MSDGGQIHAGTVRVWLCLFTGSKTVEKGKGNNHLLSIGSMINGLIVNSIVQFTKQQR